MKSFKFVAVVAAFVSSLVSVPALSQTANLNVGGVPTATCTYSTLTVDSSTGALNISCSTSVNYTGGSTPPSGGPFMLTVTISPSASGSISASAGTLTCGSVNCTGTYAAGTTVVLTANPVGGSTFTGWSGAAGCTGTGTCSVTMNAAQSVTATFSSGTTVPTPAGVVMIPAPQICGAAAGSMSVFNVGTTYSFPLPKTSSGSGQIAISAEGGVGTNAQLELSFSKTPGDWTTAKAAAQTSSAGWGGYLSTTYPYYLQQGGYVGLPWSTSAASGFAVIAATEQWYVNLRMSNLTGYLTVQISSPGCN